VLARALVEPETEEGPAIVVQLVVDKEVVGPHLGPVSGGRGEGQMVGVGVIAQSIPRDPDERIRLPEVVSKCDVIPVCTVVIQLLVHGICESRELVPDDSIVGRVESRLDPVVREGVSAERGRPVYIVRRRPHTDTHESFRSLGSIRWILRDLVSQPEVIRQPTPIDFAIVTGQRLREVTGQ